MKTQVFRIALLVMALVPVSGAMEQRQPGDLLVNIPFSFLAGNQQMPPGRYVVTSATNGFLSMYEAGGSSTRLLLPVHSVESHASQTPKLVFHRYGDSYFLTEVWNGDGKIGRQLPRSNVEKELASATVNGSHVRGEVAEVRPER
jgi:hypothetical protein